MPDTPTKTLRVATRTSKMAMAQTEAAIAHLQTIAPDLNFEIVEMLSDGCFTRFKGDLKTLGGKGAFIKALERALLANEADLAMHSYKDVPTDEEMPAGLTIPCVMTRHDPRDAAVCREGETLNTLPAGSTIGTSSVRRAAQLKVLYPHLNIAPLRGNGDTRIRKLDDGEIDAAILAVAGLHRIKQDHRITHIFEPEDMLPAATQGAICLQCRTADAAIVSLLKLASDHPTWQQTEAERHLLMTLEGSCHTPIAAYAQPQANGQLLLRGKVMSLDGQQVLTAQATGPADDPATLGQTVGQDLLAQGAREILDACTEAA